jgi:hypothetical protein
MPLTPSTNAQVISDMGTFSFPMIDGDRGSVRLPTIHWSTYPAITHISTSLRICSTGTVERLKLQRRQVRQGPRQGDSDRHLNDL